MPPRNLPRLPLVGAFRASAAPSHLAFAFDTFVSQLEPLPAQRLPQEQRPLHAYGLVLQMERCVELGDDPTWWTQFGDDGKSIFLVPDCRRRLERYGDRHSSDS